MARVGFEYPEEVSAKFADVNARLEASTIPGAGVPAEQLSFAYSVSGSAGWRPTRVYSDGQKTYIQFPRSISGQDAPVLFVVSGGQNRIVNYRMKSNMMVVDYNIDRAVLVSGVGWKQQKGDHQQGRAVMRNLLRRNAHSLGECPRLAPFRMPVDGHRRSRCQCSPSGSFRTGGRRHCGRYGQPAC